MIAAAVFVLTYALISVGNVPKLRINRGLAAALGGILMLLLGIVPFTDIPGLVDLDVIFLLLGMMLLVAGLEFSGFFRIVSDALIARSGSRVKLLAYVMVICAVLSAVALNDAVVMMFTPVVIRCCRRTGGNPIPYLTGVMFSANIGSLATYIGNPQNVYIASESGMSFIDFAAGTLPISLVCLPIAFIIIYAVFRKTLSSDAPAGHDTDGTETDRIRLFAVMAILIGALIGFGSSSVTGIPTYAVALTAGVLALAVVMSKAPKNIVWAAEKINWNIIIFFIGLFVLMGGIVDSGLLDQIASLFPGFGPGETPSVAGVMVFSAVLSNLVSNVPAVMLTANMLPAGDMTLWVALAASSTLAGNTTLIGSAANVIVSERSEEAGIKFSFWRFALIGIPVTVLTLLAALAVITVMF